MRTSEAFPAAAKVAVAVRMQDKTGRKYLDFHQKLLGGRGKADMLALPAGLRRWECEASALPVAPMPDDLFGGTAARPPSA